MTVFTFGLTVVRHGETQFNKDGILQGQAIDSPLSETGLRQADSVGRYLKDVHFSNVFVSDMQRARQTAEAIVRHNASCAGLQMVTDPALKERSFGVAEGRPVQDIRDMAQAAGQTCPDFTPPQGETPQQVKERVILFLDHLLQRMCAHHRWPDDDPSPSSSSEGVDEQQTEVAEQVEEEEKACDGVRTLAAHALVVSHGAYVRVMLRHLVEELRCSPPPVRGGGSESERTAHMFSLCPNTGVCRFVLSLTGRRREGDDDSGGPAAASAAGVRVSAVRCVFVHRADHLKNE